MILKSIIGSEVMKMAKGWTLQRGVKRSRNFNVLLLEILIVYG